MRYLRKKLEIKHTGTIMTKLKIMSLAVLGLFSAASFCSEQKQKSLMPIIMKKPVNMQKIKQQRAEAKVVPKKQFMATKPQVLKRVPVAQLRLNLASEKKKRLETRKVLRRQEQKALPRKKVAVTTPKLTHQQEIDLLCARIAKEQAKRNHKCLAQGYGCSCGCSGYERRCSYDKDKGPDKCDRASSRR